MVGKNRRGGYTLLECMISLALSALVLSLSFSVYLLGSKYFNLAKNQMEVEQSLRMVSERITRNIRMLDNPSDNVYILGNYLHIGNYIYYLNDNVLLERIDNGTNQLALNITCFKPEIKNSCLIINISGRSPGMSEDMELTIKLFLDGTYE